MSRWHNQAVRTYMTIRPTPMTQATRVMLALCSVAALGACTAVAGSSGPDPKSGAGTTSSPHPSAGASECADETEQLVARLLDALSAGNAAVAAETFAADDEFEWFSATAPDGHDVVRDHSELDDYFETAFSEATTVELEDMSWNGTSGDIGNFAYDITVTSDRSVTEWRGKGAAHCAKGVLVVWSMATG